MWAQLPTGTVTFLFSDVEGSTRLLRELGAEEYARALAEHRLVVREALAAHGGSEVDTQGDAFFLAFPTANAAVETAEEILVRLEESLIRLRIGIHTGTPLLAEEGYVGEDVHRAARIAACGHGGQVLVSAATAALVDRARLRDLGEHRLKDLSAAERIYQLGLGEFRPLKSLYRTNLPVLSTTFLGRERELADVSGFIVRDDVRLLTVTGPGGIGKTRLALQAAAAVTEFYPDGVWWVPLATVRDPELVLGAVARATGISGDLDVLIGDKTMLLLVDNLEHVVAAAGGLAGLLARCPRLNLLVTSREPLRVTGEQEYPLAGLHPNESEQFFLARARAVSPDLTAAEEVAEICRRLDQMPLALELAAARVKALSPSQILARLERRLPLLTGGARDLPERQRTLRATIAWSYELLTAEEQELFARLSVFPGGARLESAEQVAAASLDTLQSLVDKSLVRHSGERFWMFETIREYALEQLDGLVNATVLRERFARHFLDLAEESESTLSGSGQSEALERLEEELANLRASLAAFAEADQWRPCLQLAGSLKLFWVKRGYLTEGRRWLDLALEANPDVPAGVTAKALAGMTLLATMQGDWPVADRRGGEAVALALELGELRLAVESMLPLGRAKLALGQRGKAIQLFNEAAKIARETGNAEAAALGAFNLGYLAFADQDFALAEREFSKVLAQASDEYLVARSLAALGAVALHGGRVADSVSLLRRCLVGVPRISARDDTVAWAIELLGCAVAPTHHDQAARLLGAAERMREEFGGHLEGIELELHDRTVKALATAIQEPALAFAWESGRRAPLEQTIAEATRKAAT
jgi:predicted ATPase/class 3 adenylate cyclase